VGHVANAVAGVVWLKIAEDFDCAEAGAEESGEASEERGFACAVFADEDIAAAGFEVDGDLAKGGKGTEEFGDLVEASAERGSDCGGEVGSGGSLRRH